MSDHTHSTRVPSPLDLQGDAVEDLAQIEADRTLDRGVRKALREARLGQGRFREDLMHVYGGACAVTGLALPEVLCAVHLLPWRAATDVERLDPNNGLLLTAALGTLLARALITFDRQGHIRVSQRLSSCERQILGASGSLRRPPRARQLGYFAYHEALFGLMEGTARAGEAARAAGAARIIDRMSEVTIYHNPGCGTSRNTLAILRHAGIEPIVIEYLKTPPAKAQLRQLLADAGLSVRDILRTKEKLYGELGLADPKWSDDQLLDFIGQHPVLMNRPIVVTPLGTKLCRPNSEAVLEILPVPKLPPFTKEDGEQVIDTGERRGR